MTAPFEELPWDSSHFGFKVAAWRGVADASTVAAGMPGLRAAGMSLLYIFSARESSDPFPSIPLAGAQWVDRKVVYSREGIGDVHSGSLPVWSYPADEPSAELKELAFASGAHSRFKVDPNMPVQCFETLYGTWIRRSTLREIADEVLVCGEAGSIQGMVTLRLEGAVARIGLIAVNAESRGKGVGTGLVRAAEAWAAQRGASRMDVATQGANLQACALYRRCGYQVSAAEDVYHLWIAPEVP